MILLLLIIVFAYALLPREREIESIIMPCPLVKAVSSSFESKEESQRAAGLRNCGGATRADSALEQAILGDAPGREQSAGHQVTEGEEVPSANQSNRRRRRNRIGKCHLGGRRRRLPGGRGALAGKGATASSAAVIAACAGTETGSREVPAAGVNAAADRGGCERAKDAAFEESAEAAGGTDGIAAAQPVGNASGIDGVAASTLPTARERQATRPAPAAVAEARFAKPNEPARGGGRFRGKCETVANTFLLSRRETEILFFLAKGHNAAYIQEKLYISEGTAKTHIRHIYRKCDVHSQQDLMRMVENAQPTK